MAIGAEKPSLDNAIKEMASSSFNGIGSMEFGSPLPMPHKMMARSHHCKMRITIYCPDVQRYLENPESFLPDRPICINNPTHRPYWNASWERNLCLDHVHVTGIFLFNAYCEECHETISYWPEFVLPYQREPLETHEQVVIEHLQGISIRENAARIGYDPRTVSRWIKLIFTQAPALIGQVVRRILIFIGTEILPLSPVVAGEATMLLLAWLRNYAEWISYSRLHRLMGLCNLLGKGNWDLWGAPLGKARSRMKEARAPG
ncbi:hypothetical protein DCCM_2786 [Desulfocucumis palustris]|uniref:Uncharacterized protein n=1 Tax=Desulfocucumis palustris TaxID=1898651 RepID=A0A2L2XC17_9FIRM|nr:helix-turn-helix domain-containing protein [Desulfocucumis palustris]GBF33680.1 hypothetical protein DCCM_2786 [Desulfocucumis palustris]